MLTVPGYDFTKHKEFRKGEDYAQHFAAHKASYSKYKCARCFWLGCDAIFGEGNWSLYTTRHGALGMIQPAADCGLFKLGDPCGYHGAPCDKEATKRVGLVLGSGREFAFCWTCDEHAAPAIERMA